MYRSPLDTPTAQKAAFPTAQTARPAMRSIHLMWLPSLHVIVENTGPVSDSTPNHDAHEQYIVSYAPCVSLGNLSDLTHL